MKYNTKFYHILRSKIMLSKFSANLSCPTTMIANKKIVNNSNIVMEVENAHSRGTTFLDISYFSDHNRFRRKIYHLNKNKFNDLNEYKPSMDDTSYELHEINIQQCLDMIHSTLIHNYHNTTTDNLTEFTKP